MIYLKTLHSAFNYTTPFISLIEFILASLFRPFLNLIGINISLKAILSYGSRLCWYFLPLVLLGFYDESDRAMREASAIWFVIETSILFIFLLSDANKFRTVLSDEQIEKIIFATLQYHSNMQSNNRYVLYDIFDIMQYELNSSYFLPAIYRDSYDTFENLSYERAKQAMQDIHTDLWTLDNLISILMDITHKSMQVYQYKIDRYYKHLNSNFAAKWMFFYRMEGLWECIRTCFKCRCTSISKYILSDFINELSALQPSDEKVISALTILLLLEDHYQFRYQITKDHSRFIKYIEMKYLQSLFRLKFIQKPSISIVHERKLIAFISIRLEHLGLIEVGGFEAARCYERSVFKLIPFTTAVHNRYTGPICIIM